MSTLHHFEAGAFEFLEGGFPYSAGVIATQGSRLVRVRFAYGPEVNEGFERIARHLKEVGRPLTSLCAVELRSPRQFSFAGFHEFNVDYVKVLTAWGLVREGLNPVARSNVCPVFDAPRSPVFHAFTYTVPESVSAQGRDYVVAGSGEWPEGEAFPRAIVARDDLSLEGLSKKVQFVMKTMKGRCAGLGGTWGRLTAAQIYTTHDFHSLVETHFASAGLTRLGLSWHLCKPPIIGLEFEMDVRSVLSERVLLE
jgi:hypothetical protein